MSNLAQQLMESAEAVAAFGACPDDISRLDDDSLVAGMTLISIHKRDLQSYEVSIAAEITKRSNHELGYGGLARRSGSATPALFIQSLTGTSVDEARRLANLGQSLMEATPHHDQPARPAPAAEAAREGKISVDAADAIRRGLGAPDTTVGAEILANLARQLIAAAEGMTPEALWKAARLKRAELDMELIERGEKERREARYVRIWQKDGFSGGAWRLPDEDGGLEINNTLKLLLASKTGGPRFAETKPSRADGSAADDASDNDIPEGDDSGDAAPLPDDNRSMDHILADGFQQIFHNGIHVDPSVVPGSGRAPVRVIVTEQKLNFMFVGGIADGGIQNVALLEETDLPISDLKLSEYLCSGGTIEISFDINGEVVNIGREQRLFTSRQRAGLAVRDGGCMFPGCTKPPSWTEAHHIEEWSKDHGNTDICNGILLCRYHHMLIHNLRWGITRDPVGMFWLKPPKDRDPQQRLIPMPSKNPIIAAQQRERRQARQEQRMRERVGAPAG